MQAYRYPMKTTLIYIFVMALFLPILTVYAEDQPLALEGVFDLSHYDFEENSLVKLDGQWHFYWHALISEDAPLNTTFFDIPGIWDGKTYNDIALNEDGYCSIRLKILTDGRPRRYGMRFNYIGTAYTVYINGEALRSVGTVATSADASVPYFIPDEAYFETDASEIDLIIHTSNYEYRDGDMRSVLFGTAEAIRRHEEQSLMRDVFLIGSLIVMGLYLIVLYYFFRKDSAPLYLGLVFLVLAIRQSMVNERLALVVSKQALSWAAMEKIAYIGFFIAVPLFYTYFANILKPYYQTKILRTTWLISLMVSLVTVFTPNKVYDLQLNPFLVFLVLLFLYALSVLYQARHQHSLSVRVITIAHLFLIAIIINDILYDRGWIHSQFLTGYGILFFMFIQSILLARNYSDAFHRTELLAGQNQAMYESIQKLNIDLEEKVRSRTIELSKSQASIKNLLDHAGQGFLSFGQDRIIRKDYSAECLKLFKRNLEGMDFADLLDAAPDHALIADIIIKAFLSPDPFKQQVYLTLLPETLTLDGVVMQFQYKMIPSDEEALMMVIVTDITMQTELENDLEDEQHLLNMIGQIVSNHVSFATLLDEYRRFCLEDVPYILNAFTTGDTYHRFYRSVHNFKGSFAQYNLTLATAKLNRLEDQLSLLNMDHPASIKDFLEDVQNNPLLDYIAEETERINETIGTFLIDKASYPISSDQIDRLLNELKRFEEDPDIAHLIVKIREIRYQNLKTMLKSYTVYAQRLADTLGKRLIPFEIEGPDLWLDPERYLPFTKALVHVFRNALDHGIESPEARVAKGKSIKGSLTCSYTVTQNLLTLTIKDDGAGIQVDRVLEKVQEHNLVDDATLQSMTPEEMVYLITLDQLSTKREITSLSGRGYGLTAVLEALQPIGGQLSIQSKNDHGTTFQFQVPL